MIEVIGYATLDELNKVKKDLAQQEILILQMTGILETMEQVLGAMINKFIAMGTLSHEEVHRQEARMGEVSNSIQSLKQAKFDR
jgi:hypothetical protein